MVRALITGVVLYGILVTNFLPVRQVDVALAPPLNPLNKVTLVLALNKAKLPCRVQSDGSNSGVYASLVLDGR